MIKKLLLFLLFFCGISTLYASGLPQISTETDEYWYIIQFNNGGSVINAVKDNVNVTTEVMSADSAQLWKFEGNASSGYTITNKMGYVLCSANSSQNTMVKAAKIPSGTKKFKIVKTKHPDYPNAFEILPLGNSNVSMNLFGGPTAHQGVGYWTNGSPDANNCVSFISEKEFLNLGKFAIIPYPKQLNEIKEGALNVATIKSISCPIDSMQPHLQAFVAQLKLVSGIDIKVVDANEATSEAILMTLDSSLPREGYALKVNDHGIEIKAAQFAGFFYALQTLKQMLPNAFFEQQRNDQVDWSVPYLDIMDEPQLDHRGFMLDVARHFFDVREVKRILDVMSLYKMNIFHWHLTEDQGWRIEIPEYPRLTEVGSIRKGSFSNPGEGGAFYDDTEYGRGMWYSQKELKEVVAYAKARNIDIVPEVDFPGHMLAAIAAYPELSCNPNKHYEVRVPSGVSKDVLNIGNDEVIDFLKVIMDNLVQIFPYQYIHFGGDECPVDEWRNNADCLKRVKDNHLKGVEELQSWLIEELGTYVKEKYNRDIMVWDELVDHWNTNNKIRPVVMCWLGKNSAAADKGLKSIACPYQTTYLDMMQIPENQALIDEPYRGGWGGNVSTVEKIYNFNPYYNLKGKENFSHGVQANMWTETTNDNYELEYQLFPRLLAFSEVGWLAPAEKNWASFYKRLQSHDEILDACDVNYAKHYILPDELTPNERVIAEATAILSESIRGGVGYPSEEVYDALSGALVNAEADDENVPALKSAIASFKSAKIVQPQAGKMYQIYSASTYSKKQFAGSSLYQSGNNLRIHYTPQVEPEELWEFVPKSNGFLLRNVGSHKQVGMGSINTAASLRTVGTVIRIDKATKATQNYTYIPGVVTISSVSGYSPNVTGNVKRLVAQVSGVVNVNDDAALCYPGTWKLVEVTDFNAQLQGLCKKCESFLRLTDSNQIGNPTPEALTFLREEVYNVALEELKNVVTEEMYMAHLKNYYQFLDMPRIDFVTSLEDGVYYYIQNVYFSDYFAAINGNNVAARKLDEQDSQFLWQVIKNDDGTILLKNKRNLKYACQTRAAEQAPVVFNTSKEGTSWMPEYIETDQGQAGIALTDATHTYSWYVWAQGAAVANVDFRPKDWGASIWNFVKSDKVVTGVDAVEMEEGATVYYDLSGRKVLHPVKGLYINNKGSKIYIR